MMRKLSFDEGFKRHFICVIIDRISLVEMNYFRLLMFRDLPEPIGRFTYTMYVRDDLVPLLNTIRY